MNKLVSIGSGGWIRTIDLRVMSPTSCHCSTPRWKWCTDLRSQRASRQYHRLCCVSRPGSRWDGVVPQRYSHTTGSGASAEAIRMFLRSRAARSCLLPSRAPVHPTSSPREALVHALSSPPRVATPPARAAFPVISWGTYRPVAVSVLILRCISHLDAFSGSCVRT